MAQSTPIIAFDQHAAATVAAVLLPGHRVPAVHPMTSEPHRRWAAPWSGCGDRVPRVAVMRPGRAASVCSAIYRLCIR